MRVVPIVFELPNQSEHELGMSAEQSVLGLCTEKGLFNMKVVFERPKNHLSTTHIQYSYTDCVSHAAAICVG